ncbi:hypothetical protein [Streptomyces aidingensis]|uniref:Uncharacterized protein n=1 Tax=Streptomyces aidingensis TaxID=910347 RepID=A0A1I1ELY6_9ACTN|nr:hypothetical protein [Streptomyces aidingensis]SFB87676.1 hypothetical protein SAMN05421773_101350 [Streptomyces aidingensis]
MADHRRMADRRTLITGFVAGGVLCGIWLMPSAYAGGEPSPRPVPAAEQPAAPGTPDRAGTETAPPAADSDRKQHHAGRDAGPAASAAVRTG